MGTSMNVRGHPLFGMRYRVYQRTFILKNMYYVIHVETGKEDKVIDEIKRYKDHEDTFEVASTPPESTFPDAGETVLYARANLVMESSKITTS